MKILEASAHLIAGADRDGQDPAANGNVRHLAAPLWLALLSAISALTATVALLDRTTPASASRFWLASTVVCFAAAFLWWARPRFRCGRWQLTPYEPVSLVLLTLPLALLGTAFLSAVYASDQFHRYVYDRFYFGRLLSESNWSVGFMAALVPAGVAVSVLRGFLEGLGWGVRRREALYSAISKSSSALPLGLLAWGLLLSTASLSAINVNFWRYWATADGWTTIVRYPFTMTDILHVVEGGVAQYFISFPLLPSALVVSYQLAGHNTFASYLPIVAGNAVLPLAVFLLIREITGKSALAFLSAVLTASFPLLRNYTMDVGEADGLLMTSVVLAAYLRLRSDRRDSGIPLQTVAGVAAGMAALARPEGILYVIPMYLAAALGRWRDRRFWVSVLALGAVVGGFVAVSLREFGMVWPGNHSATMNPWNSVRTLEVVQRSQLFSMYASALRVSEPVLAILVAAALFLIAFGTIQIVRKDYRLAYMPALALGNVAMVFFVGPIPAEASKFHDFFRHISYGFPLLAVTVAFGLNSALESVRGRWKDLPMFALYAALAALALMQTSLLEGPVSPGNSNSGPLMTSDIHVTAAEMLADPYPLPVMKFRQEGERYVPDVADYMAIYPDDVYEHYRFADIRRFDNAADYYSAARAIFFFLLLTVALAAASVHAHGSLRGDRDHSAETPKPTPRTPTPKSAASF